jgi:threonylcarbamoyladenosine tRNA methylthiotransferase MtaB
VPGYYVENFGCRATQADGAALERQFEERGLARATSPGQASVVVLNTCTVTAAADQDARAAIRRVQRQNPDARIVVTGCYAQRAPEEIAALPGVSLVIGNSHKHLLAEIVGRSPAGSTPAFGLRSALSAAKSLPTSAGVLAPEARSFIPITDLTENRELGTGNSIFVSDIFAHTELLAAPVFDTAGPNENERTRPNLKVQDGCDNRCSFCVIPYVRGQSRSLELAEIIREVNTLVESGYREVVISGINLGRWGRDLDDRRQASDLGPQALAGAQRPTPETGFQHHTFESLIRTVLAQTSLQKLRLSSVEPMDWTDELIALVASSPRIAKHAHVPMQSSSDTVLRRMHRKYRPWHYREKIEKIRGAMSTAAIGADVMVGFPGETDAEFEATRQMIDELPFTYLHVFTYSARPGTPAASMPNQVPVHIARARNRVLRELAAEKKQTFMRRFIDTTLEAITLNVVSFDNDGEFTEGLTDNYLKLHLRGRHEPNRWLGVRVNDVVNGTLIGTAFGPTTNAGQ